MSLKQNVKYCCKFTGKNIFAYRQYEDSTIEIANLNVSLKEVEDVIGGYILTLPDGTIIPEATKFTRQNTKYSKNTIRNRISGIKEFYKFLLLTEQTPYEFAYDSISIDAFLDFLNKAPHKSTSFEFKSNITKNKQWAFEQFSYVKTYIKDYLFIDSPYITITDDYSKQARGNVLKNIPSLIGQTGSPLKFNELANLLNIVNEKSLLIRTAVTLMLMHGLRIGTLLSITEEDIYVEYDKITKAPTNYFLQCRNRYSNKNYQLVKTLDNVNYPDTIVVENEKETILTFPLSYNEYSMLQELIAHNYLNSKKTPLKKKNYDGIAVADRVTSRPIIGQKNHYVFLTKRNTRLDQSNWSQNYLQPLYIKAGIDYKNIYDKRGIGINHLLRHTGATLIAYLTNNENLVLNYLQDKTVTMAKVYTNIVASQKNNQTKTLALYIDKLLSDSVFLEEEQYNYNNYLATSPKMEIPRTEMSINEG